MDYGVAFGPGFPLIRPQALGAGPVSAAPPNARLTHPVIASLYHPLFRCA
jgi:hypothetical protein